MKRKHLFLVIAALLAAGGLWFARSTWRAEDFASNKSSMGAGSETADGPPEPGQMLNPPNPGHTLAAPVPNRRFTDFTPEERVQFARQGHGPGG